MTLTIIIILGGLASRIPRCASTVRKSLTVATANSCVAILLQSSLPGQRENNMATSYKSDLVKICHSLGRKKRLGTVIFFVTSVCNAKCRTCFYWEELNQRGDLTWDEIRKLSASMPQFSDLWLSGGEPMLRRELTEIIHLFHTQNGVRWVNLPTNGLLPERTAEWVARICEENPELHLDLNIAMDGLHEMQDSIRAVPGNFAKTLQTIEVDSNVPRADIPCCA